MWVAFRFPLLWFFLLGGIPGFGVGMVLGLEAVKGGACVASTPPAPVFDPNAQRRANCYRFPNLAPADPLCRSLPGVKPP
jgi:hypothetical protein